MTTPTLVWFRQDLRTIDNPALTAAYEKGNPILPVYIYDEEGIWAMGAASKWWLHHSLISLDKDLKKIGLHLIIRKGKSLKTLQELIKETKADTVFWNRCYEPDSINRDKFIKAELKAHAIDVQSFNANLLFEPWTIANKQGKPFQVFTPFWRHCVSLNQVYPPLPIPHMSKQDAIHVESIKVEELQLLPRIHWDEGIKHQWQPGTEQAMKLLNVFIKDHVLAYKEDRDRPDHEGVSRMSPYLHFGEISARMIWHTVLKTISGEGTEPYLRQLGWREFAHHLLYHFPHTPLKPLREEYNHFPWLEDAKGLKVWQKGLTGYPMVDAGMRQLWATGWMHNRVRMIVGSFLVKDLLLPWQEGAKWFWDTLVDADLANNTLGWQWVAGCGADAAPYFRIFNPVTQGEKFDPDGNYVREWVPELKYMPADYIHRPWEAPDNILRNAGVTLGVTYPQPVVDHGEARERALLALKKVSKNALKE